MSRTPAPKRLTRAKPATVYTVVRAIPSESPTFTEPDRVFATLAPAQAHADALNRELRVLLNPFADFGAGELLKGGEKALNALVKRSGLPAPTRTETFGTRYTDWGAWWDRHYYDLTDAQRDAIWDALDGFDWYQVKKSTLED